MLGEVGRPSKVLKGVTSQVVLLKIAGLGLILLLVKLGFGYFFMGTCCSE